MTLSPPAALTEHEISLKLIKARPPEPSWAYYLLAAGTALGGVTLGWIYLIKDGANNKAFGLRALLLGLVLPVVVVVAAFAIRATQVSPLTPTQQPGVLLPE